MSLKKLDARGKGESAYDLSNDILFFKIKERDYKKSLELNNFVLDIDKEGYITGIQIFDASKLFRLSKNAFNSLSKWEFIIKVEDNTINLKLHFSLLLRNKRIQKEEIIMTKVTTPLLESEVLCEMKA
ncbi:DUF2283 domain-containing protein [Candidatus Woesearchaeota archaeon]|nr:DUF2283 domain-containing protein [Candidatus Woesearchaeota archaeon]